MLNPSASCSYTGDPRLRCPYLRLPNPGIALREEERSSPFSLAACCGTECPLVNEQVRTAINPDNSKKSKKMLNRILIMGQNWQIKYTCGSEVQGAS